MKRKFASLTIVAVLVLGAATALFAQSQRGGWGPGTRRGGMMPFMGRYLQLTAAQRDQIKSMWQAERSTTQPLLQQLASQRKQMMAATANGKFDAANVQAIANQQSQTTASLMVERQKLQAQIYNQVLTPDQRTKFDQMRQKQVERLDKWLQHMSTTPTQ